LADLLQKVAGLLLVAAAMPAHAAFSHKVHLKAKLDCVVCHSAAPSSTKATDGLMPAPGVCANCHPDGGGSIKKTRTPAVSKFNHQLHIKMGGIGAVIVRAIDTKAYLGDPSGIRESIDRKHPCKGCHRGLENSDAVTAAAYPKMADCLVCHNKIDPPFSCVKCHSEEVQLKPASHTPDWIDVHSAGKVKDKTGCAVCHGRKFTCLGCH
jgi:hypothetical protein